MTGYVLIKILIFISAVIFPLSTQASFKMLAGDETYQSDHNTIECHIVSHHHHRNVHHTRHHSTFTIKQEKCYDPDTATEDDDQCTHPDLQIN